MIKGYGRRCGMRSISSRFTCSHIFKFNSIYFWKSSRVYTHTIFLQNHIRDIFFCGRYYSRTSPQWVFFLYAIFSTSHFTCAYSLTLRIWRRHRMVKKNIQRPVLRIRNTRFDMPNWHVWNKINDRRGLGTCLPRIFLYQLLLVPPIHYYCPFFVNVERTSFCVLQPRDV